MVNWRSLGADARHARGSRIRFAAWLLLAASLAGCGDAAAEVREITGLVLPLTDTEFSVRTAEGDVRVQWDSKTRVGRRLESWTNVLLRPNQLVVLDPTTADPEDTTAIDVDGDIVMLCPLDVKGWEKAVRDEKLHLQTRFSLTTEAVPSQIPSEKDPRLIGVLEPGEGPGEWRVVRVGERRLPIDPTGNTRRFEHETLLFGRAGPDDIKPFITDVYVIGEVAKDEQGVFLRASEIGYTPLPDATQLEDPKLPRLLVVGDSISGNYDASLRHALAGKINVHHPPENAGNTGVGMRRIRAWLGAYHEKGRGWDVIAFNFGHWNDTGVAGARRATAQKTYQEGLEYIIAEMEKTGARLIWATTTPIPRAFGLGDTLHKSGKNALINEWANVVMSRHPSISVVDLWSIVQEDPLYSKWRDRQDVHFTPTLAEPFGRAIATEVLRVLGREGEKINPPATLSAPEVESQRCCLPETTYRSLLEEARGAP